MSKQQGMTLIELMVVMAVVAILGTIAVSSYRSQMMKSNRSEAKSALLQVQVAQEKFFLQNNRYAQNNGELVAASSASPPGLGLSTTTPNGYYTIDLNGTASMYTATATAANGQLKDTACKTFAITQQAQRTSTNSSNTASSGCW